MSSLTANPMALPHLDSHWFSGLATLSGDHRPYVGQTQVGWKIRQDRAQKKFFGSNPVFQLFTRNVCAHKLLSKTPALQGQMGIKGHQESPGTDGWLGASNPLLRG